MTYGLSIDGFKKKSLSVIKEETEAKQRGVLGEAITFIPQSVFGAMVGIESEEKALLWESLEGAYNAMYPSTSQGKSLDKVGEFIGIARQVDETYEEFRVRYKVSVAAKGKNNADSLFGQLLELEDVTDAKVVENKTGITENGIPPHQFLTVVEGGTNTEIADIIWKNTPQGIDSFGAITEQITDQQGDLQNVNFSRPLDIPIYFEINITADTSFPVDGDTQIKDAIVAYGDSNFTINKEVILSRFYTPINTVTGVVDIEIFMGLSANPITTANIPIGVTETSLFEVANIVVNVS